MLMLSVSPHTNSTNEKEGETTSFSQETNKLSDEFSSDNLLDDIDFSDIFDVVGIEDGDVLPDLELDPEMFAEFSAEGSDVNTSTTTIDERSEEEQVKHAENSSSSVKEESVNKREDSGVEKNLTSSDSDKGRKPSKTQAKGSTQGKRKVKVDWTPDLHRQFVQAVEQLGLDKAVPSRILEIMGIECLTRHNIASHLQKYRSHRKHLLAREAEAANWNQRRQAYSGSVGGDHHGITKRIMSPWHPSPTPTMGFPPHVTNLQHFRPLHVWGHPTVDQSLHHLWPKHLVHSPPPPPPPPPHHQRWAPPPSDHPPYWIPPPQHGPKNGWVPNSMTQGTPCFPRPMTTMRLSSPPVPGIPPQVLYKAADSTTPIPDTHVDFHPSEEIIDSAIGEVLAKPLLPLPLGLKPPSLDSVLVELQRQGISKIPPSCCD